jgi:hypothetical protein
MRVLVITPLYPPDIKEPAPYVKELASRLSVQHAVTVLAYNHIPEQITGVEIIAVEKSALLPVRLWRFFRALMQTSRETDVLYVQNGPSVELPVLIFSLFNRKSLFVRLGDEVALEHSQSTSHIHHLLESLLSRAAGVVTHTETSNASAFFMKNAPSARIHNMERPLSRPEILPFTPHPSEAETSYETSWNAHVEALITLFEHGN